MNEKKKSYYAKIGIALLKLTDYDLTTSLDDLWDQSEQHEEYYDKIFWLHGEIEKSLSKCPDIKNVKRITELRKEHFDPFIHYGEESAQFLQESSSILSFDLFFPKAERKYAFEVRYHERVIEKAHVLYNGNIFLAYTESDDEISLAMFGQEVREFIKECLSSSLWEVVSVPPCPLHPDINVNLSIEESFELDVDEKNDINIKIPNNKDEDIDDFFVKILDQISFSVNCFASTATINQKLNKFSWEIQRKTNEITAIYKKLLSLDWKRIKQKFELMRNIRGMSLDIQILSNEFTNTELKLKKEKESFNPKSSDYWNDNFFKNYFYNYFKIPPISLPETRETIKYMNEIISNKYLHYYTIVAALIGGVVGSVITKVPSALSNLYKLILPS